MKLFQANPVTITHEGRMIGVLELKKPETKDKDYLLEVENAEGIVLFKGKLESDTFLSFDIANQKLIFNYRDVETKEVMDGQDFDLYALFYDQLNIEEQKQAEARRHLYDTIVELVKEQMDSPEGTPQEIEHHTKMLNEATTKESARLYVTNKIREIVYRFEQLSEIEKDAYAEAIYADLYGLGVIQELDDDPDVGEIMVNGYVYPNFHCDIYYVKKGKKIKYNKTFRSLNELLNVYSRVISFSKKDLNNLENAIVEATRSNRDRVNIIIPDASESYVMNIRKFGNFVPNLRSMKELGTVDDFIDTLMEVLVKGKANIGVGGAMGTGKTTFINFALGYTDPSERKVVIASVSETDIERTLKGHDVVILNVDDIKGFTFDKLKRSALRTTADRIIVPESRGEEFKQVYEANLQTKGNMFTAHALDDYAFLDMCVDMYAGDQQGMDVENLRNKIAKSLDIIIIMRKVGDQIRIKSISEVVLDERKNFDRMNLLYYWHSDPEDVTKGEYRRTENRMTDSLKERLNEFGVPMSMMEDL